MKTAIVLFVCAALCPGGSVFAQGFVEGLEAAQAKIDEKQWREALEILLPLKTEAEVVEDLDVLAARLKQVGAGLCDQREFPAALSAYSAELDARRRIHGGVDHPDVAASLSNVAFTLESSGRRVDAQEHRGHEIEDAGHGA